MATKYTYKPLDGLWPWFKYGIIVFVVAQTATVSIIFASSYSVGDLNAAPPPDIESVDPQLIFITVVIGAISLLGLLCQLHAFFQYWRFFARAMGNAYAASIPGMTMSRFGIGAWHFVPIANLVMPYMAVREIWDASIHGTADGRHRGPLLRGWWMGWLGWSVLGFTASLVQWWSGLDGTLGVSSVANSLTVLGEIALIVSTVFLLKFAFRIKEAQSDLRPQPDALPTL